MRQLLYGFSFIFVVCCSRGAEITIRKLVMDHEPRARSRKKRNSLSRDDEGPPLPVNKRIQSSLVITGTDGKIMTRNGQGEDRGLESARSLSSTGGRIKKQQPQLVRSRTCDLGGILTDGRKAVPNTPAQAVFRQPGFSTPQPCVPKTMPSTQHAPNSLCTPWKLPRTPYGSDYAATPSTQPRKIRLPTSSNRKLRSKAVVRLQMLDDQEVQASRLVQARRDLFMERQERAFVAWLNHILKKPIETGEAQLSTFKDFLSRKSVTPPTIYSNSAYGGLKLIDEVFWDEHLVTPSLRDQASLGRSPRQPLIPLNGISNRGFGSPGLADAGNFKRSLKDAFSTPDKKGIVAQTPTTPHLSSKRLKMITEHGVSYARDAHLQDVCRVSDLARRLKLHFSHSEREEILSVMIHLAKHIDEGRLRMKRGCAILADVALKKKGLHVLMNYSAYWLRIGLHVVLGHTALLKERLKEDDPCHTRDKAAQDAEYALLEVFLERHFLAHPGLAKKFATNKAIEGLYRDGYSEALGRVILKRFFLLVLVLDKAKLQTAMKITDGIDGVDGGSPPLFRCDARVKSSRQALQDFLSDVMHGEGDVVGNLSALGYHVYHSQVPLADYDFAVADLIEDLQDGVRLCRLVQLLAANDTLFLEHIRLPSNGKKRRLHNCQIALESLAQAGVPLEDEHSCSICAADIVSGNRDKVCSLLWNIMIHLQIPLLVSRPRLCQEIAKLQGTDRGISLGLEIGTVELLLKWTQVTCMIAGNLSIRSFKTSFADGQALCLIVNLYLPVLLPQNALLRPSSASHSEERAGLQAMNGSDVKVAVNSAYKKVVAHNFGLVQNVVRKIGSIPEVLQLVDLLGDPSLSERNIIIFVAFLCSRLLNEKALDLPTIRVERNAESETSCQLDGRAGRPSHCHLESESPSGFSRSYSVPWEESEAQSGALPPNDHFRVDDPSLRTQSEEIIATVSRVQSRWRDHLDRRSSNTGSTKSESAGPAWRKFSGLLRKRYLAALRIQSHWRGYRLRRTIKRWNAAAFIIQARYHIHVRRREVREQAAQVLQHYFRAWAQKRKYLATVSDMCKIQALWWAHEARGSFLQELNAVRTIERERLHYIVRKRFHFAQIQWRECQSAQIIQAHWRGYCTRRILIRQSVAASIIQSWIRDWLFRNRTQRQHQYLGVQSWRETTMLQVTSAYAPPTQGPDLESERRAVSLIEAAWLDFKSRRRMKLSAFAREAAMAIRAKRVLRIQASWRGHVARQKFRALKASAKVVQESWRRFLARRDRDFILSGLRSRAALRIQKKWRCFHSRRKMKLSAIARQAVLVRQSWASTKIQAVWRGYVARRHLQSQRRACAEIQRGWRFMCHRRRQLLAIATQAALVIQVRGSTKIQAHWRCYVARQRFLRLKHSAMTIQSAWRVAKVTRLHRIVSATAIQARWRSHLARNNYLMMKARVITIQQHYRGHLERKKYQRLKGSVLMIQAQYRARVQRRIYQELLSSLRRFQAWWRCQLCRRRLLVQKSSATIIQRQWRIVRKRNANASKIQAVWRGNRARRALSEREASASLIQRRYRGHLGRKSLKRYQKAALIIQVAWRAHSAHRHLLQFNFAAQKIQSAWRRRRTRRRHGAGTIIRAAWLKFSAKRDYARHRKAAILIQSLCRAHIQRRQFQRHKVAACIVQAQVKGWLQRRKFQAMVLSAGKIQAAWRGNVVRAQFGRTKWAVERVQSAWRQFSSRRRLNAALQIQSIWRAHCLRKLILRRATASVLIQQTYRAYICRKRTRTFENLIVKVQALWRGELARRKLQRLKEGVTRIQAALRGMLQRRRFSEQRKAARKIQFVFRTWRELVVARDQERVRLRSARLIQTSWRCLRLKAHGYRQISEAEASIEERSIQECESRKLTIISKMMYTEEAMRSVLAFPGKNEAVTCTNHIVGSFPAATAVYLQCWQQQSPQEINSERIAQAPFSALSGNGQACTFVGPCRATQSSAAVLIQRCWRSQLARRNSPLEKERVCVVDDVVVHVQDLHNLSTAEFSSRELKAAQVILGWLKTSVQKGHRTKVLRSVILLQRHIRGWLSRRLFSRAKRSVILIQARWRGHAIRQRQRHEKDPLGHLRLRMKCTASTVRDSERLCNRLTDALSLLLSQKTVSGILNTCRTIDVATQHSLYCCERLAESGAVPTILSLIQTINRSPPLEQVLKHSLSILKNLARYSPLATKIAQAPSAISIITEQLHAFRNHEEIFALAISVLRVVYKTPAGIAILQRERPVSRRLHLIVQSFERKVQVEKRNLEKLSWTIPSATQRKSAEKKLSEAHSQFLAATALMKDINRLCPQQSTTAATPMTTVARFAHQHSATTPARRLIRPVDAPSTISAAAKRVSTPCYHQRPPRAVLPARRVTDVPFRCRPDRF